ncbi:hypothetical protein CF319_g1318 [Tilletia indica]|nr:hypothetical protein CF319_g1318 [Tilletia indica]
MEDLIRSLRALGIRPPSGNILVDLLSADADPKEQKRLADLLALEKLKNISSDDDEEEDIFITPDVVRGALLSLLDSFSRTLSRARDLHKREFVAFSSSSGGARAVKAVPRAALLNRQASDIRRAQEEYESILGAGGEFEPEPIPRLILEGGPYFTSTTPLEKLDRMGIADFQAPKHFAGRYLLCRVISPPLIYVGCTLIIEDPLGLASPLSIAHFTSTINLPPSSSQIAALLPLGTILAIREPYVSLNHQISSGGPVLGKTATGVRVSSLTDVVVLEGGRDDHILQGVQWKVDLLHTEGKTEEVEPPHRWLREGSCARNLGRSGSADVVSIRPESVLAEIETFLEERRPGAAYRELSAARRLSVLPQLDSAGEGPQQQDALLQQVINLEARILHILRAYEGLRNLKIQADRAGYELPEEQASILANASTFRTPPPSSSSSAAARAPTQALIQSLYTLDRTPTALTPISELYDHDYISPAMTIKQIPNAGRGFVTVRDVKPGEVLLCCNAVEPCFTEDERWAGVQVLRLGLSVGEGVGGLGEAEGVSVTTTQVLACTRLVHALVDRPELRHAVLGLTAGPQLPFSSFVKMEEYPVVTDAVLDPARSLDEYVRPDIDAKYIDGVLQYNAFGPGRDVDVDLSVPLVPSPSPDDGEATRKQKTPVIRRPPPASSDLSRASIPHPLPAILNHACTPNVSSIFLSSTILTHALIPLPKGTEIAHPAEGGGVGRKRVEVKEGKMGAVVERSRMVVKNRRAGLVLRGEEEDDVEGAFEGIVREVEGTYDVSRGGIWDVADRGRVVLKPELFDPYVHLARHRRRKVGAWWESVQCEIKALRSVGAILDPSWMVDSEAEWIGRATSTVNEKPILIQAPILRLVDAQRALVRIARTLRKRLPPSSPATRAPMYWLTAAYDLNLCMIGAGRYVFFDILKRTREGDEWEEVGGEDEVGMVGEEGLLEEWAGWVERDGEM